MCRQICAVYSLGQSTCDSSGGLLGSWGDKHENSSVRLYVLTWCCFISIPRGAWVSFENFTAIHTIGVEIFECVELISPFLEPSRLLKKNGLMIKTHKRGWEHMAQIMHHERTLCFHLIPCVCMRWRLDLLLMPGSFQEVPWLMHRSASVTSRREERGWSLCKGSICQHLQSPDPSFCGLPEKRSRKWPGVSSERGLWKVKRKKDKMSLNYNSIWCGKENVFFCLKICRH